MSYYLIPDKGLRDRFKRCIKHQNSLNCMASAIRDNADESNPDRLELLALICNQLTGALGMCDAAGIEPETLIEMWVDRKEAKFPELKEPEGGAS